MGGVVVREGLVAAPASSAGSSGISTGAGKKKRRSKKAGSSGFEMGVGRATAPAMA